MTKITTKTFFQDSNDSMLEIITIGPPKFVAGWLRGWLRGSCTMVWPEAGGGSLCSEDKASKVKRLENHDF